MSSSLPPDLPDDERAAFDRLGAHLLAARPVPAAHFRGELRRAVVGRQGRRRRARRWSLSLATAGCMGLAVAVAGIAGAGPLAPPAPVSQQAAVTAAP